jgi:hypothetical protein
VQHVFSPVVVGTDAEKEDMTLGQLEALKLDALAETHPDWAAFAAYEKRQLTQGVQAAVTESAPRARI